MSIVLTTILMFTLGGGKEKWNELEKIKSIYTNVFVLKNEEEVERINVLELSKIYTDLTNEEQEGEKPEYHFEPNVKYVNKDDKTIYQLEDYSFIPGTGFYENWGSKIIFILEKGQILEVQYKKKSN